MSHLDPHVETSDRAEINTVGWGGQWYFRRNGSSGLRNKRVILIEGSGTRTPWRRQEGVAGRGDACSAGGAHHLLHLEELADQQQRLGVRVA